MVKFLKHFNTYITVILLLMLAGASIFAPQLLSSTLFSIVYVFYAVLIFISIFVVKNIALRVLHLLLAMLIISAVSVKAHNERYFITLPEGQSYSIDFENEKIELELLKFSIDNVNDSKSTPIFESLILKDKKDMITTSVNHPYKYKTMRLYQSSYGHVMIFDFISTDTIQLFEGQSALLNDHLLEFKAYDQILNKLIINFDGELFYLEIAKKSILGDTELLIKPKKMVPASILEYVETKGHTGLLLLSVMSVLMLIFVRIRRN